MLNYLFCHRIKPFTGATTAQVTPLELTTKLMNAAIEKGAKLLYGAVEGIDIVEGKIKGVKISGDNQILPTKMSCRGGFENKRFEMITQ